MLAYSAMKKNDQRRPLYSVWKPATSSLSASARSNGARLQLAVAQMKKIQNAQKVNGIVEDIPVPEEALLLRGRSRQVQLPATMTGTSTQIATGHFVTDDLGRLAHAAEQRPFAAGAVAGEDDAEHFGGHHRQHEEDRDAHVEGDDAVAERQGQECEERAAKGDIRAEPEEEMIGIGGIRSSLTSNLMPSAIVWSQPNLPPMRVGPRRS